MMAQPAAGAVRWWTSTATVRWADLPLAPGGLRVGLGLWFSLPGTLLVESALFFGGLAIYVRMTRPRNRRGRWALGGLVAFLLLVYALNLFGPAPPVGTPAAAIAGPALAMWLLALWAWWADRNRDTTLTGRG